MCSLISGNVAFILSPSPPGTHNFVKKRGGGVRAPLLDTPENSLKKGGGTGHAIYFF